MNPYLVRQNRPVGKTGRLSEKKVLKSLGAKATPASGAMVGAKGDGELGDFLLELKSTTAQSIAISVGWLSKISQEALNKGKTPAVVISFVMPDGSPQMKVNSEWVMVPRYVFVAYNET
jgi:hypothetical protein